MAFRWPSFGKPTWQNLRDGDKREIYRFAWFPQRCSDGHTYWLRRLHLEQEWDSWHGGNWKVKSKLPAYKIAEARLLNETNEGP